MGKEVFSLLQLEWYSKTVVMLAHEASCSRVEF